MLGTLLGALSGYGLYDYVKRGIGGGKVRSHVFAVSFGLFVGVGIKRLIDDLLTY